MPARSSQVAHTCVSSPQQQSGSARSRHHLDEHTYSSSSRGGGSSGSRHNGVKRKYTKRGTAAPARSSNSRNSGPASVMGSRGTSILYDPAPFDR
eukprot:3420-Heterococcus_DN1.PRE.2